LISDLNTKMGDKTEFAQFSGPDQIAIRKDIIVIGKSTKKLLDFMSLIMLQKPLNKPKVFLLVAEIPFYYSKGFMKPEFSKLYNKK